ncbi:hypothetical protein, partial [Bacillus sp. mrc49]
MSNGKLNNQFSLAEEAKKSLNTQSSVSEVEVKEDKLEAAARKFKNEVDEKKNRKGIEDTHKRATFLVEKD